jgi:hypothetical protein
VYQRHAERQGKVVLEFSNNPRKGSGGHTVRRTTSNSFHHEQFRIRSERQVSGDDFSALPDESVASKGCGVVPYKTWKNPLLAP